MKISVTETLTYAKENFSDLKIGTFFKRTKENETGWYIKVSEYEVCGSDGLGFDYDAIWFGGDTPLLDFVDEDEVVEVANEVSFTIR
ncbi:hypothetical protein J5751_00690 [bacterium]|nr:hypothetical protein [bacterium]